MQNTKWVSCMSHDQTRDAPGIYAAIRVREQRDRQEKGRHSHRREFTCLI